MEERMMGGSELRASTRADARLQRFHARAQLPLHCAPVGLLLLKLRLLLRDAGLKEGWRGKEGGGAGILQ